MKKSRKGFKIAMIRIMGKDRIIDICNDEGESIKTTREQRNVILKNYKNKTQLITELKKTFNNQICDDELIISITE